MLRPFLVLGLLSAATGAYADPQPLTGDGLKALSGSLVELDTPLGTKLPIRFGSDGLVSAEAGDLAPLLGSAKDRGRWWIDGDKLCSKWFRWFDAEVRCITVSKDGTRLYWRKDDGETGTATLIDEPKAKDAPAVRAPSTVVAAVDATAKRGAKASEKAAEEPKAETPAAPSTSEPPATSPPAVSPAADATPPRAAPVQADAPTALADASAAPTGPDETKMRFGGGDGLLAASSRVASDTPVAHPVEIKTVAVASPATARGELGSIDEKLSPLRREQRAQKAAPVAKPKPAVAAVQPEAAAQAAQITRPAPVSEANTLEVANFGAPPDTTKRGKAAPLLVPSTLYRVQGVERYDVLNVRRGPSEQHEQIASIPPTGRRVEITGRCQDDWCPIRYGRVRGWVNRYYLAAEAAAGSSSQSQVYFAKP